MNVSTALALQDEDISLFRELSDEEAQAGIHRVLVGLDNAEKRIEDAVKRTYAIRGWAAKILEERELYGPAYPDTYEYLKVMCPKSYKYVDAARKDAVKLDVISYADYVQMPRCNIKLLAQASSGLWENPEIIEAAKTEPENLFRERLNLNGQHLDCPVTLKFTLDASAASIIAAVLDEIGTTENIPDRSGQLEWLCQDWRDGGRVEPETIEAQA